MKTYHLFISHSWTYSNHYTNLVNLLDQADSFHYMDYSIPEDDPVHISSDRQLSQAIKNHMQSCGIVLVLAGIYASYSKWIDKEIHIAQSTWHSPKPILAIELWESQRTSPYVKRNADKIVEWDTNSIVSAIKELA